MNLIHLILIAVLLFGTGFLLHYESLRNKSVNWLYLFSGGLALYLVETANHDQPFQNTMLLVVGLCLIPITIDGLVSSSSNGYRADESVNPIANSSDD